MKLTIETKKILESFDNQTLFFLKEIKDNKNFASLTGAVNAMIDYEKNQFFAEKEFELEPQQFAQLHAYSRGTVAGMIRLLHLVIGAEEEIKRRDKLRKNG